jgi:hypothetical protein
MVGELLAERGEYVLVSRYPPEHNAAPSNTIREEVMKTYYTVAASMLAGFGLGSCNSGSPRSGSTISDGAMSGISA